MKTVLLATKTCHEIPMLERKLNDMGIPFELEYAEDHPLFVKKHNVLCSPTILIDGKVVFRGLPADEDLEKIFIKKEKAVSAKKK